MREPTIRVELIGGPHSGRVVDMEEDAGKNLIRVGQAKPSSAQSYEEVIAEKDKKMREERVLNKSRFHSGRGTYVPLKKKDRSKAAEPAKVEEPAKPKRAKAKR